MAAIMDLHLPNFHPMIRNFPEMSDGDLDALTADIAKNGQRRPIALYDGYLWDGRSRLEACRRLLIQPRYWLLRKGDPVLFLIARNNRFGAAQSPERRVVLEHFRQMDTPEAKAVAKKRRAEWMAEARSDFRWRLKQAEPCAVCGKHREMAHAHHSLSLNLQFDLGIYFAIQEFDWLCPTHHWMVHVYISIYITCTRPGQFLEGMRDAQREQEWLKAGQVFRKGQALFEKFGGMNHDRAALYDRYPQWAAAR